MQKYEKIRENVEETGKDGRINRKEGKIWGLNTSRCRELARLHCFPW